MRECPDCDGTGWAVPPWVPCFRCGGSGYIENYELEDWEREEEEEGL